MRHLSLMVIVVFALLGMGCGSGSGGEGGLGGQDGNGDGTGGGGSDGGNVPQLDAGVDLSGSWAGTLTLDSVQGTCDGLTVVPGQTMAGSFDLDHDPTSGSLNYDGDTATMNGTRFSFEEAHDSATSGESGTTTHDFEFSADGNSVSGKSRIQHFDADGDVVCDLVFSIRGARNSLLFQLDWDSEHDIDLEAEEPDGTVIYWGFEQGGSSGGRHSGDANSGCTDNLIGMEEIRYASPQSGSYKATVFVSLVTSCVGLESIPFTLTAFEPGKAVPTVIRDNVSRGAAYDHQITVQ